MPASLDARLSALEQASKPTERVTVIRFVSPGHHGKPLTRIEHDGRVWHILPNESDAAFIARVRSETTGPRILLLGN
ncbi:MAG: hypothetical protein RLZZ352_2177 [Pseudomonadota bacterium]|jgi:hypothetical protein